MLKALIFDFDGLILDTETPEFEVLQEIYAEYGQEISIQTWGRIIGGDAESQFDALGELEKRLGEEIPRRALQEQWRKEADERIALAPILPGVLEILAKAEQRAIKLAVASSSPHSWVDAHLQRLGIYHRFEHIICADDVTRTKPSPELFNLALTKLKTRAERAVVFEDSPNGVKAANAAGIPVVAIPNPVTVQLAFEGDYVRLSSLLNFSFEKWMG